MTVKELIEKLSSLDTDAQVLVRFTNSDASGLRWKDLENFDEDDFKVNGHTVIIDIINKQSRSASLYKRLYN